MNCSLWDRSRLVMALWGAGPGPAWRRRRGPPSRHWRQRCRRGAPEAWDARGPPPVLVPCHRLCHICRPRGSAMVGWTMHRQRRGGYTGHCTLSVFIPPGLDSYSVRDQLLPSPPNGGQMMPDGALSTSVPWKSQGWIHMPSSPSRPNNCCLS